MEQARHVVFRSDFVSVSDVGVEDSTQDMLASTLRQGALIFVRSGAAAMHGPLGTVVADVNYVLLGSQNERLCRLPLNNAPCVCTVIQFNEFQLTPSPQAKYVLSSPRTHLLQARLLNSAWLGRESSVLDGLAHELFSEIAADGRVEQPSFGEHAETVRTIKMLLNESPSAPLSLKEFAQRAFLSPFTVSRIFHRQTGISLRRYIKRLRLRIALNLMLEGGRNLTGIATELGFYDQAHFSKAFHSEFGIAPALAFGGVCDRAER